MTVLKLNANNFVPLQRTPWAGTKISEIKKKCLNGKFEIPNFIGESWEISTDDQFPSFVIFNEQDHTENNVTLKNYLKNQFQISNFSLCLKWLQAKDKLSVQVHPPHSYEKLTKQECGKPEAWFVCNNQNKGSVYLGFKNGVTKEDVIHAISSSSTPSNNKNYLTDDFPRNLENLLFQYQPKEFDYISIPTGCVHAVGAGPLMIEPQEIVENKSGKTFRLFDWNRLYDGTGNLSENGYPRELHVEKSLEVIDWDLPREQEFIQKYIVPMGEKKIFLPTKQNPFGCEMITENKNISTSNNYFYGVTVLQGQFQIGKKEFLCGESGVILGNNKVTARPVVENSVALLFFVER